MSSLTYCFVLFLLHLLCLSSFYIDVFFPLQPYRLSDTLKTSFGAADTPQSFSLDNNGLDNEHDDPAAIAAAENNCPEPEIDSMRAQRDLALARYVAVSEIYSNTVYVYVYVAYKLYILYSSKNLKRKMHYFNTIWNLFLKCDWRRLNEGKLCN